MWQSTVFLVHDEFWFLPSTKHNPLQPKLVGQWIASIYIVIVRATSGKWLVAQWGTFQRRIPNQRTDVCTSMTVL